MFLQWFLAKTFFLVATSKRHLFEETMLLNLFLLKNEQNNKVIETLGTEL